MTKYVIGSGGFKNEPAKTELYMREVFDGFENRDSIRAVFCFFAMPREKWEEKILEYTTGRYKTALTDTLPISWELALPDTFEQQVRDADVVMFLGGDDELLEYRMARYDLEKLFADTVIATLSASSDLLSQHYWTCDWRGVRDGRGLFPVKIIPHYQSDYGSEDTRGPIDWEKAHAELTAYGDVTLPIHALPEGEFIVFEK